MAATRNVAALVWCPPCGAARRFPRRGRALWGGPAALVSCPLIGELRGEWTATEPGEGRHCGAGGAVLGNEIGALDRCSISGRYPGAGSAVSPHAQAWRRAPAPRLPTSSVARRLY